MLAGGKTFVTVPGENLVQFRDEFISLMDESGGAQASSRSGGRQTPPQSSEPLPESREVHAGGKKFYFDVERNDRGTFIRLSEVRRTTSSMAPNTCHSNLSPSLSVGADSKW